MDHSHYSTWPIGVDQVYSDLFFGRTCLSALQEVPFDHRLGAFSLALSERVSWYIKDALISYSFAGTGFSEMDDVLIENLTERALESLPRERPC